MSDVQKRHHRHVKTTTTTNSNSNSKSATANKKTTPTPEENCLLLNNKNITQINTDTIPNLTNNKQSDVPKRHHPFKTTNSKPTTTTTDKTKEHCLLSNNRSINILENNRPLMLVGNNNTITIARNNSAVSVVGDCNLVQVGSGRGSVMYVGNSGCVKVAYDVPEGNVSYAGNCGVVLVERKNEKRAQFGGVYCGDDGKIVYGNLDESQCFVFCNSAGKKCECKEASVMPYRKVRIETKMVTGNGNKMYVPKY